MRRLGALAPMAILVSSCEQLGKRGCPTDGVAAFVAGCWSGGEIYFDDRAGTIYRLQQ